MWMGDMGRERGSRSGTRDYGLQEQLEPWKSLKSGASPGQWARCAVVVVYCRLGVKRWSGSCFLRRDALIYSGSLYGQLRRGRIVVEYLGELTDYGTCQGKTTRPVVGIYSSATAEGMILDEVWYWVTGLGFCDGIVRLRCLDGIDCVNGLEKRGGKRPSPRSGAARIDICSKLFFLGGGVGGSDSSGPS